MQLLHFTLFLLTFVSAENWVVLVCGSEGYSNYRHHADVAHAYQIVRAGGVDPDNIITMMYNDVPFSSKNPFPGKLFNRPGDEAPDVYDGVIVDYMEKEVSPENLIKVLTGVYSKDEGQIFIDGKDKAVSIHSPQEAQKLGISTVYQEITLCPNLSVAENMYIGRSNKIYQNWKKMTKNSCML